MLQVLSQEIDNKMEFPSKSIEKMGELSPECRDSDMESFYLN